MSEWKQNERRTSGFPEGIEEGMVLDVKFRNGDIERRTVGYQEGGDLDWLSTAHFNTNDGYSVDVMAYRVVGETAAAPAIQPKTAIELQAEEVGIPEPVQEWPEDRVDVIGQNGNDGLHYDAVTTNKYQRIIKGVTVDVYDVLAAFGVNCQARGHAIKKLLMAGQRGHKDEVQDLREAVQAIERSIDMVKK